MASFNRRLSGCSPWAGAWGASLIITVCVGLFYAPMFVGLVHDWVNLPDFSHGFFIPALSLYFVWDRRDQLQALPVRPANTGFLVIVVGLLFFFLGKLAAESFTMRFSLLVVVSGIVLFHLGRAHLKAVLFPILFLVFMIPVPSILLSKITFPMQLLASRVAAQVVDFFNIPILREGNILYLADTTLEVAEACSGIRSLISLLALGTVLAYLTQKKQWQKIILFLACFPVAIVVNAFRVSATAVLANYFGEGAAQGFYHDFSGYILFIVSMVLLYGIARLLTMAGSDHSVAANHTGAKA